MVVTELGISIEVRLVQELKAFSPMVTTEEGISIDLRALQLEKELCPMLVIP